MFAKNLSRLEDSLVKFYNYLPDLKTSLFFLYNSDQQIFENAFGISEYKKITDEMNIFENFVFRPGLDASFDKALAYVLEGNTWEGNGNDFFSTFLSPYFDLISKQKDADAKNIIDTDFPDMIQSNLKSIESVLFTGVSSDYSPRTGLSYHSKTDAFTDFERESIQLYHSIESSLLNLSIELDNKGNDYLTGLLMREPALFLLEEHIKQGYRTHTSGNSKTLSVAYVDLNNFKPINDRYGHRVGDYVLQKVADRIQNSVRNIDNVSRFGGDEFVIIMPNSNHSQEQITERLHSAVNQPIYHNIDTFDIRCSIGISIYPDDFVGTRYLHDAKQCTQEMIDLADHRMYLNKTEQQHSKR
jgi:diguanylate cyclase (GGDEF)-like protein